jgi:hypothetical protein
MFIFSITPTFLNYDSNGVMVDAGSQTDILEHKLMALESLFGSLTLNQYLGFRVTGVDNTSIEAVTAELQVRRDALLEAVTTDGTSDFSDAQARLEDISAMQQMTDTRISDLEKLMEALNNGTISNTSVSNVDSTNMASIEAELKVAVAYRDFLKASAEFWTKIYEMQSGSTVGADSNTGVDNNNTTTDGDQNNTNLQNAEALAMAADLRRRINELIGLFDALSSFQSKEVLESRREDLNSELQTELAKINSVVTKIKQSMSESGNSQSSASSVSALRSELKSVAVQISSATANEELKSIVGDQINTALNSLLSA